MNFFGSEQFSFIPDSSFGEKDFVISEPAPDQTNNNTLQATCGGEDYEITFEKIAGVDGMFFKDVKFKKNNQLVSKATDIEA